MDWNFFDCCYTDSFIVADEVTDNRSKDFFLDYLSKNWKNIGVHTTADYCHCDLAAYNGETNTLLTFELKKRNVPSDLYGDALLTMKKYRYLTESSKNLKNIYPKLNIRNLLVTFYNDNVFYMWNINDYSDWNKITMSGVTEKSRGDRRKREVDVFVYRPNKSLLKVEDPNISKIYQS